MRLVRLTLLGSALLAGALLSAVLPATTAIADPHPMVTLDSYIPIGNEKDVSRYIMWVTPKPEIEDGSTVLTLLFATDGREAVKRNAATFTQNSTASLRKLLENKNLAGERERAEHLSIECEGTGGRVGYLLLTTDAWEIEIPTCDGLLSSTIIRENFPTFSSIMRFLKVTRRNVS
ncbi:MAG: hypothetical protein H0T78_08360 [Longispora sp.]|nr:hypothetical protein [Longispora sp. (in: high G+C Gram-positive bacteria)]